MEEEIEPYRINQMFWTANKLGMPDLDDLDFIAKALVKAEAPLIVTGYTGRDPGGADALVELADSVPGLRVLDTAGTAMCFPADHPAWLGVRYGEDESISTADVLIVLECDVRRCIGGYSISKLLKSLAGAVDYIEVSASKGCYRYSHRLRPIEEQNGHVLYRLRSKVASRSSQEHTKLDKLHQRKIRGSACE